MSSPDQNRLRDQSYAVVSTTLDAGAFGSTDDLVAEFSAAVLIQDRGDVPIAQWLTRVDSATLGTTFQLNRRGIYVVKASVPSNASANLKAGISLDAPVASRQVDFLVTDPDFFDFGSVITPAATNGLISLMATIPIIQAVADSLTLGVVRLGIGDTAGGPATAAEITVADVFLSITRVSDLN